MAARAGDWIPVSVNLATREEVLLLASRLKRSRAEVIGWLIITWSWFSVETTDGRTRLDVATLAQALAVPESFLRALPEVGWFRIDTSGCAIVNWDRWLSDSAKRRAVERHKKAAQRKSPGSSQTKVQQPVRENAGGSGRPMRQGCPAFVHKTEGHLSPSCPDFVPKIEGQNRDQKEKEKEKKNKSPPEWISTHTLLALEPGLGQGRAKRACAALNRWFSYLDQRGRPPVDPQERAAALLRMFPRVETLEGVINYAVANEYVSLRTSMAERLSQDSSPEESPVVKALEALTKRGKEASHDSR